MDVLRSIETTLVDKEYLKRLETEVIDEKTAHALEIGNLTELVTRHW